jgi:ribosomal protein S18 acetylase RimI-like enzyme
MDVAVREVREQDYENLCVLLNQVDVLHSEELPQIFITPQGYARSREYINTLIADDDQVFFAAECQGTIVGCILVGIRSSADIPILVKRRYAYIDDIVIDRDYRQSGLGKMLMERAEKWIVQKGISQIELNVWDFNRVAISFFDKMGYAPSRHFMWKTIE